MVILRIAIRGGAGCAQNQTFAWSPKQGKILQPFEIQSLKGARENRCRLLHSHTENFLPGGQASYNAQLQNPRRRRACVLFAEEQATESPGEFMQSLEKLKPLALLLLRVVLGVVFLYHGLPKLSHAQQWTQNFAHMGFPGYFAYIAGVLEVFGGAILILGMFTRMAGLLLAIEMGVAVVKVHGLIAHPSNVHGYEFPLVMCASSFVLAALGAGLISIDQALFERRPGGMRRKE
jgi:putative oxidoreductase